MARLLFELAFDHEEEGIKDVAHHVVDALALAT
jgi:hypothetical protein